MERVHQHRVVFALGVHVHLVLAIILAGLKCYLRAVRWVQVHHEVLDTSDARELLKGIVLL